MKNKKMLLGILMVFLIGCIGVTVAYYSSRDTFNNVFNTSNYIMETKEKFESPNDWMPGTTTPKEVIATNRGDTKAVVRVKLEESWEDSSGNPLSLVDREGNQAAIINFAFDKDIKWIYNGGYYYYVRPLDKDESTTSLTESVTFNPNVVTDYSKNCTTNESTHTTTCTTETTGYGGGKYKLDITVETSQYDKYQEVWNTTVQIDDPTKKDGILMVNSDQSTTFGNNISRDSFEKIIAYDIINIPDNAIDSWDASAEQNESVIAWYTDIDNNGLYELYLGQEGGVKANPNSSYAFSYFQKVEEVDLKRLNTSLATNMSYIFSSTGYNSSSFKLDASNWDTSKVTDLSYAFSSLANNAYSLDMKIHNWAINENASVERLFSSFASRTRDMKIDLTGWDLSNIKNLQYMFYDFAPGSYKTELIVKKWNTSGVENMNNMFNHAFYYTYDIDLDFSDWDTSSVTNMNGMFHNFGNTGKNSLKLNFTGWDTSNVTDMDSMFYLAGCYIGETNYAGSFVEYIGLNNWNVSNVEKMYSMFSGSGRYAENVIIGDLSNWNTSKVTNMDYMFFQLGTYASQPVDIGTFKVYASSIYRAFSSASNLNGTINIYTNPTSYNNAFNSTSTTNNSEVIVNYSNNTTNIDRIIATKSSNSNVIKGSLLNS